MWKEWQTENKQIFQFPRYLGEWQYHKKKWRGQREVIWGKGSLLASEIYGDQNFTISQYFLKSEIN